jgi:hypothetical protein
LEEEIVNAAEPIYSTRAFAPPLEQSSTSATTSQYSDVLARRQREAAAFYYLEPKSSVTIPIGQHGVVQLKLAPGTQLPSWISPVIASLAERWGAQPGWDSYDAKPTQMQHVLRLLNHLSAAMLDNSSSPVLVPLSDGGIQAEWHRHDASLEIVVPSDEPTRYYYYNAATEEEEEDDFESNRERVQKLIAEF